MNEQYYLVVNGKSVGPLSLGEIILNPDLKPDTLVWKTGLSDWIKAIDMPELEPKFRNNGPHSPEGFSSNPQYDPNHTYQQQHHRRYNPYNQYQGNYRPSMHTNWLPWAIVATVVGFFASCIGAIFGIIAIVQANKANTLYSQGYDREADSANSNAKIMTIIGLIFAGIGIIIAFSFGNIINTFANYSYI